VLLASGVGWLFQAVPAFVSKRETSSLWMALLAFGLAALFLVAPVLRWRQTVELFERGLVWKRLRGVVPIAYNDVADIRRTSHIGRDSRYDEVEIVLRNGQTHSIEGIESAEKLCDFLTSLVRPPAQIGSPPPGARGVARPGAWTPGSWKPPAS
jgi:hypothetical protein